jgi:hypothetical protein
MPSYRPDATKSPLVIMRIIEGRSMTDKHKKTGVNGSVLLLSS